MKKTSIRELYRIEDTYWWNVAKRELLLETAKRYFPPEGEDRVLEIGPGAGRLLADLESAYRSVFGVELSDLAISACAERGVRRIVKADAEKNLPAADGCFGLVLCADSLEHFSDDAAVLREAHRVLRKGGGLIVSVPAYPSLYSYWDESMGHVRRYTKKNLAGGMRDAGFVIEKLTYANTFILPVAIIVRKLKGLMGRNRPESEQASDFMALPGAINNMLIALYRLERVLIRHNAVPFGLSILGVARKI